MSAELDIHLVVTPVVAWLLVRELERSWRAQTGTRDAVELRDVARTLRAALADAGVPEPPSVMLMEETRA